MQSRCANFVLGNVTRKLETTDGKEKRCSLASEISSDISLLIDVLTQSVCHIKKDLIIVADPKLKSAGTQERKNDRGTMG
jgi:hypothetical protein